MGLLHPASHISPAVLLPSRTSLKTPPSWPACARIATFLVRAAVLRILGDPGPVA